MSNDVTPVVRRMVDAMQINLAKIQQAVNEHPESAIYLQGEYERCRGWLERYNETRRDLL